MLYTISNGIIEASVSDMGAELKSLKKDDVEYLWQGNPEFWSGSAPNLFPICGRLTDGKYTYRGKTYEMILHGFAKKSLFTLKKQTADSVTLELVPNEEIAASYPFDFIYTVEFSLNGAALKTQYTVKNTSNEKMFFALGGHPGFNVPIGNVGNFEDWYVEFAEPCKPELLVMNACYTTDDTVPYELIDGKRKMLDHGMFDNDAQFLKGISKEITLKSDKSSRSVTLRYPDMKYLGFWHKPETKAPYMCIEPWMSVPAYYNKVDNLETKRDMLTLEEGGEYSSYIDIILN